MSQKYEQFLGSDPGLSVDLTDSGASPHTLKTTDGFEFVVSADDFNHFYRPVGDRTPSRWMNLVTDSETGLIDTRIIGPIVDLIHQFEKAFNDFTKARAFLRWSAKKIQEDEKDFPVKARKRIDDLAKSPHLVSEEDIGRLLRLDQKQKELLMSDTCAEILWPVGKQSDEPVAEPAVSSEKKPEKKVGKGSGKTVKTISQRMKNVEMEISGNTLIIRVDLSQDFGPSKSGRNNIVATTEGNKTISGREERIGMTVYREIDPKLVKKGAKDSFKNLRMEVEKDNLILFIDLQAEIGPSKSGKNLIIASTGGNQLVLGRPEKIGLNVYRAIKGDGS